MGGKADSMEANVATVLQKINFIEQDIELQKNILAAIPTGQDDEVEQVIRKITQLKEKVAELKDSIQELDPVEHARILKLETATERFRELAQGKTFTQVITLDQHRQCEMQLKDGTKVECLVMARDEKGGWTVLTIAGDTCEYVAHEVLQAE